MATLGSLWRLGVDKYLKYMYSTLLLTAGFIVISYQIVLKLQNVIPFVDSHWFAQPPIYRIRTRGCNMRKFNPFHPSVASLIEKVKAIQCPGKPNFIHIHAGQPHIDEQALSIHKIATNELMCKYKEIFENYSLPVPDAAFSFGPENPLEFGRPLRKEFLFVSCSTINSTRVFHEQFLLNPILKKDVEDRSRLMSHTRYHNMSVLVLGVDSVSYLNFRRHLPLTADFIRDHLHAFELNGYNKVGDNSFPNQCALLTGLTGDEVDKLSKNNFYDDIDLIWKSYASHGYRTLYLDENPVYGLFNYLANGFHVAPTDYYLRPATIAVRLSHLVNLIVENVACLGPTLQTDMYLHYLSGFVKRMRHRPFFAFVFLVDITHNFINHAGYVDAPLRRFFDEISDQLNNTLLVFLSDHGLRFGTIRTTLIGKFEDRQPFAFLSLPKWFLDGHQILNKNLATNQDRLTTHFDVHATLKEFLQFPNEGSKTKRGLSLFHEIPESRTCSDASIAHHYCSCEAVETDKVPPQDVLGMARTLVREINSWLNVRICYPLTLNRVKDVMTAYSSPEELRNNVSHYLVTIETSPAGAIFEATLRVNRSSGNVSVDGSISRCDRYYGQSSCIADRVLEKFCICRRKRQRHVLVRLFQRLFRS
ncbi:uncharacterized protein LOC135387616 [Ornithodoros turicata]|uniref:uncharacterized protein LOC135387616 n=1 Tax=Ornithodoros turicata TaxID=34597 RepID=UPI00313996F1